MATQLLSIFFNNHFSQMSYPEKVQEQLDKWGLPPETIDVVEYPGEIKAPFNVNEALEVFLLTEQVPPEPTPSFIAYFNNDFKKTPLGRKFLDVISYNNKILKENNIPPVPIEFEELEIIEPVYYTVDEKLVPVSYMRKGKMIKEFK